MSDRDELVERFFAALHRTEMDGFTADIEQELIDCAPAVQSRIRQDAVTIASKDAEIAGLREAAKGLADRLTSQDGEPWPNGTDADRLHYWRDKAIVAARELATLSEVRGGDDAR